MQRSHAPTGHSRRKFLQVAGSTVAAVALSGCRHTYADVQGGSTPTRGVGGGADRLYVYSWAGYFDNELLRNFEEATGIKVVADVFDSNEAMLSRIQAGGGNQYSILYPSDYMVQEMRGLKLLQPLDRSRLQGVEGLLPKFQNSAYDPNNAYSVPANWGTTGLIYDPARLNPGPADWQDLWDDRQKLSRRLTLFNDVREVMGAALRSLGFSYNTTNPQPIEQAYRKLLQLKPAIANFTTDGWRDQIISGDLFTAMAYSSDAIAVIDENPNLRYVIPASGSSLWVDTMAIPTTAPNPEAAYAWINFMLDPGNAARISERLKLATASAAAIDLLPNRLKANTNLFPDAAIIDQCEGIAPVGEATDLYDRYWTQLTSL